MTIACIADLIKASEGLRLHAYDDATGEPVPVGGSCEGTLTIGYGHTGSDVHPGLVWTEGKASAVLALDLSAAQAGAAHALGGSAFAMLDPVRQAVLTDIAFQIGGHGLAEFVRMLTAIRAEDWPAAAQDLLASDLARETPERTRRNAAMLLSGEWPAA